jgi:hypothetical protein
MPAYSFVGAVLLSESGPRLRPGGGANDHKAYVVNLNKS